MICRTGFVHQAESCATTSFTSFVRFKKTTCYKLEPLFQLRRAFASAVSLFRLSSRETRRDTATEERLKNSRLIAPDQLATACFELSP